MAEQATDRFCPLLSGPLLVPVGGSKIAQLGNEVAIQVVTIPCSGQTCLAYSENGCILMPGADPGDVSFAKETSSSPGDSPTIITPIGK